MNSTELQKALKGLWTVQTLCQKYRVTPMTIRLWRVKEGLPAVVIEGEKRPTLRFVPSEAKAWMKSNRPHLVKRAA
jgi:hypothetical protein